MILQGLGKVNRGRFLCLAVIVMAALLWPLGSCSVSSCLAAEGLLLDKVPYVNQKERLD